MDAAPISIDALLERAVAAGASDLHVVPGAPPTVRVHGDLSVLPETERLMPDTTRELLYRILSTEQQKQLEVNRQLDFSHGVPGLARFRSERPLSARLSRCGISTHPGRASDPRRARSAAVLA